MNKTVQLILDRMESNPEEFYNRSGRWMWIGEFAPILTKDEISALEEGQHRVRLHEFHARAMETILNPNPVTIDPYTYSGSSASSILGGAINTINLNNTERFRLSTTTYPGTSTCPFGITS